MSKSVLRVAAEKLAQEHPDIAYFPSYEIITGAYTRGAYFGADLRSVTESGVAHVMRLFMKHYTTAETDAEPMTPIIDEVRQATERHVTEVENIARVICEEELLQEA